MFIILLLFMLISFPKLKFVDFNDGYISKNTTTIINGIFVLLVLMGHFRQYVTLDSAIDLPYIFIHTKMDQLIVTTFLFFSGYGMYESYKRKGDSYVDAIFKSRFLKLCIQFAIAVACFLVMNIVLGIQYDFYTTLLSFIGWESIGNSNWYIFVMLGLYLLFYVAFKVTKKDCLKIALFGILTCAFIVFLKVSGKPVHWYNTMLCFFAGIVFSYIKDAIIPFLKKSSLFHAIITILAFVSFIVCFKLRNNLIMYECMSILFVCVILLCTMKVQVESKFLTFMGSHVFSIYIFQRIPMIFISTLNLQLHPYVFFVLVFVITIAIAVIFDILIKKIKL